MELEQRWPRPRNETRRLEALHQLAILDRPADSDLEALARVAAYLCGAPAGAVNLIDENRQYQAAAHGKERDILPRDLSLCGYAILQPGVTYTPDASADPTFQNHPFVDGRLGAVRLYASAPVIVSDGFVVGSLCVFGDDAHPLDEGQLERLADLAAAASRLLELRRAAGSFAVAATTDPLTGLANRSYFEEHVAARIDDSEDGSRTGLLYLDLDGFKPVNDTHGHHCGDAVLQAVAARLAGLARAGELIGRVGGDEFTVLVSASTDADVATALEALAARIEEAISQPIALPNGTTVRVGASIGRATAEFGESVEALFKRADSAMYAVKAVRH